MVVTYLDWDSTFFEKKIYRLLVDNPFTNEDLLKIKELEADVFYIVVNSPLDKVLQSVDSIGAVLVDKKITYRKLISSNSIIPNPNLRFVSQKSLTPTLEKMVYESGLYSRFKIDVGFEHKFKDLYKKWIVNSLNREVADEVLVAVENNYEAGFVTLSKRNGFGQIGLLAVDENFRGRQIGINLLLTADCWYKVQGISEARVVTQINNIPACRLYEKAGYSVEKIEYIFHLWN
jgi:dTDP-4-amino-4,6-dideoxy-D-galactose acyltransferase